MTRSVSKVSIYLQTEPLRAEASTNVHIQVDEGNRRVFDISSRRNILRKTEKEKEKKICMC